MAKSLEEISTVLEGLNRVSQRVGPKMNMDKTKVMSNVHVSPTPVLLGGSPLEVVDDYVYLGQTVQLGKSNFEKEVNRRTQLGWAAFGKLRSFFSSKIPQSLKTKVPIISVITLLFFNQISKFKNRQQTNECGYFM